MYLKHYNLILRPFEISPDPKFLWLGEKHKEALAAMKYGILDNKGFISLTGDVGAGKTTLVNALANSLGENIIFAQISDPALGQLDFLNLTADAFKMNKKFSTKGDFLIQLRRFLNIAYVHHKEVVLVIEEAQRFDPERLEEVRLISNIEKPDKKLINIVFVGQYEFNSILKANKALRQRIAIIYKINPLQEDETEQYVTHRLKIAGSERKIFSSEAIREIYTFSKGNPRLINTICDVALLTGYAKEKKIIDPEIIRECAANYRLPKQQTEDAIGDLSASSKTIIETDTGLQPGTSSNSDQKVAKKVREKPAWLKLAYVGPMVVVILSSIFGYLYFFGDNHAPYRNLKTFLGQAFDRYIVSKPETSSQNPDQITVKQSNIAGAQVQALNFKTQETSIENQLGQLRSSYDELAADLKELKKTNARVSELERVAAMREQKLSLSEQQVTDLTQALDRAKKGQELLRTELLTKADLIAELEQKLALTISNRSELENNIEKSKKEIAELQEQLLDAKAQKGFSENQLEQLRSSYEKLSADLNELKGAQQRVTVLEGELATKNQALSGLEQRLSQLAKELDQEKQSGDRLSSKLSTKEDLIAELQKKLANAQSNAMEFEAEINNGTIKINELQAQLDELKTQQARTLSSPVKEIAELQSQLLDLKAQKAFADTQLGQLKSRNEKLSADMEALKGAKERVADLAGVVARREQTLSRSEQKVRDLTNALDQEKKGQDLLRAELSTKADLVAGLQQKLEATLSSRAELENDIEKSENEIAELQGQLLDLNAQKTSSENQLDQLRFRNEKLTADLEEFKGAQERVAALEGVVARRDQTLSQAEQKLVELAEDLKREKASKVVLNSELSTKVDLVAELQQKLESTLSSRAELVNGIGKIRKEIAALQNQQEELKAQLAPAEPLPVILDVKPKSTSKSEVSADPAESPSPSDIIDWVFKKKAK